jgi:hypothetical protein
VVPAKSKYADSKSSTYLRGTWLKTKKYQTVILAYLRYVSTRIIAPCLNRVLTEHCASYIFLFGKNIPNWTRSQVDRDDFDDFANKLAAGL